jgi:hypothetical protein
MLNRISKILSEKEKKEFEKYLSGLENLFDFFITLTHEEKRQLYKMGAVHMNYIKTVFGVAEAHPDWLPSVFNVEEYAKDVKLISDLHDIHSRIKTFFDRFECTMLQLGHEAMKESDEIYSNMKHFAKKSNDPEVNAAVRQISDQLKQEVVNSHAPKN